jgi:pimeloyl-ACP methyl ester carboxylesterase
LELLAIFTGKYDRNALIFWSETWLRPDFRDWNIESYLKKIECPVLCIQGENDEFATMKQVDSIVNHLGERSLVRTECLVPDAGHSPHIEKTETVLNAVDNFIKVLPV